MIDLKKLRELPNPYRPIHETKLAESQFIGRNEELSVIDGLIDGYKTSGRLDNILIVGDRSIGKSTLLDQYSNRLSSSFAIYYKELSKQEPETTINYFVGLIDHLINQFTDIQTKDSSDESTIDEGLRNTIFDPKQIEIWKSLIHQKDHDSNFLERKLDLSTIYARNGEAKEHSILKDMKFVVHSLITGDFDVDGLVLVIDEFQELDKNPRLLEILTLVTREIDNIMIIGAGLKRVLDNIEIFEKFNRSSRLLELKKFNRNEIREAITKPIILKFRCTEYEATKLFDIECIRTIETRTDGNPYHLRILCAEMFDYFKENRDLKRLVLNRDVMEKVMQQYARSSKNSKLIKASLDGCDESKISSFARLYRYNNIDLRSIILADLAFDNITPESEDNIFKAIIADFEELSELELFRLKDINGKELKYSDLSDYSSTKCAEVSYTFIGDQMDRLYASYYYESIKEEELVAIPYNDLADILAVELGKQVSNIVIKSNLNVGIIDEFTFGEIEKEDKWSNLNKEIKKLERYYRDDEDITRDSTKEKIQVFAQKYDLYNVSMIARLLGYEGYYCITINATIKGKQKISRSFNPIKEGKDIDSIASDIGDKKKYIFPSLDEYLIEVHDIYVTIVPKYVVLLIFAVRINDEYTDLVKLVSERKIDKAVHVAENILSYRTKIDIYKKMASVPVNAMNNYAFCLMNMGELKDAEKEFDSIKDKELISKINLGYIYQNTDRDKQAKTTLKKVKDKTVDGKQEARFLNLGIMHEKIESKNTIIEDISFYNCCCWNLTLIAARRNEEIQYYAFKKLINPRNDNERKINRRVNYWTTYYWGNKEEALEQAKQLYDELDESNYLKRDVEKDIVIFESEQ